MLDHKKSAAAMEDLIAELGRLSGQIAKKHSEVEGQEMAEGVEPETELGEDGLPKEPGHEDSPMIAGLEGHSKDEEESESPAEISEEDKMYIQSKLQKQKKGLPMGLPFKK